MQNQSSVLFVVLLTSLTAAAGLNTTLSKLLDWSNTTELRPIINGYQNRFTTVITNDGPTLLGSKTLFNVTLIGPPGYYLTFQWGTFIPYVWKNSRTYEYTERLEVEWWKSTGSKSVYFYIDALQTGAQKWTRVAQNSSTIQVIDYLSINVDVYQNGLLIINKKLNTGAAKIKAHIHDPSGFFEGTIARYIWTFNDGTSTKVTQWNEIDHSFLSEGLFLVQVSASLKKNGKLYKGETSFYISIKGKIEGYILAWKEDDHHPTLPSKEKSLPLGLVNFQFKLVDKYSSFAGATFSYVWNYGDGTIVEGTTNTTHEYQKLGNIKVVLGVNANKNGNTYHSLIYKNISIRAPIKDLDVKSHSKLKKGNKVQFNITCHGSSPVSFCWYVTRGSCELPSDVMCSPTRLYHHCRNTINHTFRHTGDYCVNVTVMNTVSFAEKSINVLVDDDEVPSGRKRQRGTVAAAVLPIVAGILLFIAAFLGVKYKIQYRQRLARKTEVATFDFRSSQYSLLARDSNCAPPYRFCPTFVECKSLCPVNDEFEPDHEMEERRMFCEEEPGSTTPKRKISYYGSIHRILGQSHTKDNNVKITEEDPSPFTPRKNLSKSV